MATAMLADFATRLACGLAATLLATPWRVVPPAFFRTQCHIILGLLVLAALDLGRVEGMRGPMVLLLTGVCAAYIAAINWGLGLYRFGQVLTAALAVSTGLALVGSSMDGQPPASGALNAAGRLASASLMGSTLTAMLLGHHYLTAPAMSIDPLRRFVRWMAGSLVARAALAGLGAWLLLRASGSEVPPPSVSPFFLAVRWGMGFGGAALATYLTWKTVEIRSTQSATGILYIAFSLVLFGELAALTMSRGAGVIL